MRSFADELCNHADMPNWDDVRIFLALEREGTLLGAGKVLHVNHTTVARRLKGLEQELGTRLLDQTPDGYVLTPAGETIVRFAESMEDAYHGLERQVTGHDERVGGVVRVATTETFAAMFFVPRVVGALRRRYPDIEIEVVSTVSAFDLPRRQADLAIRMTQPTQQGLVLRKLATLAFGLYGSREYFRRHGRPRHPGDLSGHALIGYDRESTPNVGARWLAQAARGLGTRVRCDHILSVRASALAGHGLAVFPCFLASGEPELERVGDPVSSHEIWLVQHPDLQRTARIRAVADVTIDVCRTWGAELSGEAKVTSSLAAAPRYSRRDRAATRRARGRSRR
jgi:DNA-binding transcriptional LysR family regulator